MSWVTEGFLAGTRGALQRFFERKAMKVVLSALIFAAGFYFGFGWNGDGSGELLTVIEQLVAAFEEAV
jgi:hypothetical protein